MFMWLLRSRYSSGIVRRRQTGRSSTACATEIFSGFMGCSWEVAFRSANLLADSPGRTNQKGTQMPNFGDHQLEIYFKGLQGERVPFPIDIHELEAKASVTMPRDILSYV